ncbi:MAG: ATP-binding protein [Gammaproteobacteria bacterium RIFCSPHIGHO2_12_FULL_45_9]|nr:MAG: ATP-binding protein [Gammaproteobacteria bacterium RIFCSPHIGHO2_12_FULL_45_9]
MRITADLLKRIIADQQEEVTPTPYITRTVEGRLSHFADTPSILVLKGMRRSGKSALLHHVRSLQPESDYYFNFEDERLAQFTTEDFQRLQETFITLFGLQRTYYFDEIQNIPDWEIFVRRLYTAGNKIYITGSNAHLFSAELGTRLTGRYISLEIYPFSFLEFLNGQAPELSALKRWSTTQQGQIQNFFHHYCQYGGIPEYVKYRHTEYLQTLYESILYRDIIARHHIVNPVTIRALIFYLASNCSKETSYSALKKALGSGSATTISDYCHYLEEPYLCFFVNRYSESVKAQMQSPKKVYFIDHALAKIIGFHFSDDTGRLLENLVFIELKRREFEIYYYKENKECDFIARKPAHDTLAIQVCKNLHEPKTRQREYDGLLEALHRLTLSTGYILTEEEEERVTLEYDGQSYTIQILPLWKWLIT